MPLRINSLNDNYTTGNFTTGNFYDVNSTNITSGTVTSSDVSATTVSAGTLNATSVASSARTIKTGRGQRNTVVGYAPTNYATALINTSYNAMIVPGLSQATSVTDTNLLHIPASSVVTRVVITNNGVTLTSDGAGANTSVGTYLTSLGVANVPTVYFIGSVTQNGVNAGRAVGGTLAVSNAAFGTTGAATTSSAVSSVTTGAGDSLVGIQVTNANMLTGSLRVTIEYTNA